MSRGTSGSFGSPRRPRSAGRRKRDVLNWEALESRLLLANFPVDTFADDGSATSLRGAIAGAIAAGGSNTIKFVTGGTGGTIQLSAGLGNLPAVPQNTTFDFSTSGLGAINLDGSSLTGARLGLRFLASGSQLQALGLFHLINFSGTNSAAIVISGDNTLITGVVVGIDSSGSLGANTDGIQINGGAGITIGASGATNRNVVSGSTRDGIRIGSGVSNLVLANDYIGLDTSGTLAVPNDVGIFLAGSTGLTLGTASAGSTIVVSGNTTTQIEIQSDQTTLQNAFVGTKANGTQLASSPGNGVLLNGSSQSTIGGTGANQGNLISGNASNGISITPRGATNSTSNSITGNTIGLALDESALGNGGSAVLITDSGSNVITSNTLSGNQFGVKVMTSAGSATSNTISANKIGIDSSGNNRTNSLSGIYLAGANVGGTKVTSNTIGFSGVYALELNAARNSSISGNSITGNSPELVRIYNQATGNSITGLVNTITGGTSSAVKIDGANTTANVVAGAVISGSKDGVLLQDNASANTIGGGNSITGNSAYGVHASASGNFIGGATPNTISGNTTAGVMLDAASNTVSGNWIGLNAAGTSPAPNGIGIIINGVSGSSIGGISAATGNTIAGNTTSNIYVENAGTTGTVILGNLIGLDSSGSDLDTTTDHGVLIDANAVNGSTIGGSTPNTISGHAVAGIEADAPGWKIAGNVIGLNGAGTSAVANAVGVVITGANVVIGGTTSSEHNTISGNTAEGILIKTSGATGVSILGNLIGLNAAGLSAVPNSIGVHVDSTAPAGLTVGGSTPNTISGNSNAAIRLDVGSITVAGNIIGLDATGTSAVPNPAGLVIDGITGVTVGGSVATNGNTISGNSGAGIDIKNGAKNVAVLGNVVGLDVGGTTSVPNASGIFVESDASTGIVIGGTRPNTISGNTGVGITINGDGVKVAGNLIGLNAAGTASVSNQDGVLVNNAADATIGGTVAADRNTIAGNTSFVGVRIRGGSSTGLALQGNVIGLSPSGTSIANSIGVLVESSVPAGLVIGGTSPNTISGNTRYGVEIDGSSVKLQGNVIGLNSTDAARPNGVGVRLGSVTNITIGGSTASQRNVISGNTAEGILLDSDGSTSLLIQGNYIGTNSTGDSSVGNSIGIHLIATGSSALTVGGDATALPSLGNVISGNNSIGLLIEASGTSVQGNTIGLGANGSTALGNSIGVSVVADNVTIGGNGGASDRNVISGNTAAGVTITGSNVRVEGNYIGTDQGGTVAKGNSVGVAINSPNNVIVGGNTASTRNVISGNSGTGVWVQSAGVEVIGNYIGTDKSGTGTLSGLPSTGDGVKVSAANVSIGGNNANRGNTIAGNPGAGIRFTGSSASTVVLNANAIGLATAANSIGIWVQGTGSLALDGASLPFNTITGNTVGVQFDTSGNSVVGYRIEGNQTGIVVDDAGGNTIGGINSAKTNTISGNTTAGIELRGSNSDTTVIQRNVIGLNDALSGPNANGIGILVNGPTGILLDGTDPSQLNTISGNIVGVQFDSGSNQITAYPIIGNQTGIKVNAGNVTIGGNATTDRNTISGSSTAGIELASSAASSTVVRGNWIGLDNAGTGANGNAVGILNSGASGWTLDETNPNTISGNTVGVSLTTNTNLIYGNKFGFDSASGTVANDTDILISGGSANSVGGTIPNSIQGSTSASVRITGASASSNRVRGNVISNVVDGVLIDGQANGNTVGGTAFGDGLSITSASRAAVEISGPGTSANVVLGNTLSGNSGDGVLIGGSAGGNTIGGSTAGSRNLINDNSGNGVRIDSNSNLVQGNYIGTADGTTAAGNSLAGVAIFGASNRVDGNLIAANRRQGVRLSGPGASANTLTGNSIGVSSTSSALGNQLSGVSIEAGAASNVVSGLNTIGGNLGEGILVVDSNGNTILANLIGTTPAGLVPNQLDGIKVDNGSANTIGASGQGNTIAGNAGNGVSILNGSDSNVVRFNSIGLDSTGAAAGNTGSGVSITDSGSNSVANNTIGANSIGVAVTTTSGNSQANSITGNNIGVDGLGNGRGNSAGIVLSSGGVTSTLVTSNRIGFNSGFGVEIDGATGNTLGGNTIGGSATTDDAVLVHGGASNNSIGLFNSISGGSISAVHIDGSGTFGNEIRQSTIDADNIGVLLTGGTKSNTIDLNTISNGSVAGVQIGGVGTAGNAVTGNSIGGSSTGVWIYNQAASNTIGGGNTISGNGDGILVQSASNTIGLGSPNLIFNNTGVGIRLQSSGNLVQANRVGLDITGAGASGNATGILVENASGNTIGGTGNTISGNLVEGLLIQGPGSTGTVVQGNLIGLDSTGTTAVGNSDGVVIDVSTTNIVIGGSVPNTIAGNSNAGVRVAGSGTRIINNLFGLDASGAGAIPNGSTIVGVGGVVNVSIGGTVSQRNTISGQSAGAGLVIDSGFGAGLKVVGNWFGLAADGLVAAPNSIGVRIASDAPSDLVFGGASPNIISGNSSTGVRIERSGYALSGNWIGLNATGTAAVGNSIGIMDVASNVTVSGNTVSGNTIGIRLSAGSGGASVVSNLIGFQSDGIGSLGNQIGVLADASAPSGISIGAVGSANTIGNSSLYGVQLSNSGTNLIGNVIGLAASGTSAAANAIGVLIDGASATVSSNRISGNTTFGIRVDGAGSVLIANTIGEAGLGNGVGILVNGADDLTIGGIAGSDRNVISGNTAEGILIGGSTTGLVAIGNYVGTDPTGMFAVPNAVGVRVDATAVSGVTFGGSTPNLISGNLVSQVEVDAAGTIVSGNWIGLNATGLAALVPGSNADGVVVDGLGATPTSVTIGGNSTATGNTIGGLSRAIHIHDVGASGAVVSANVIGLGANRSTLVPNSTNVLVEKADGAIIGGSSSSFGNVVSGSTTGVELLDAGNTTVRFNVIGTDGISGTLSLGNQVGIHVHGNSTDNALLNNLIAANSTAGILVEGSSVTKTSLEGNTIGLDASGVGLGNGVGVRLTAGTSLNTIGGTAGADRNVVSGNTGDGILIDGDSFGNLVQNNRIGTDSTGSLNRGNGGNGVRIDTGFSNTIGTVGFGNVISGNVRYGVEIQGTGAVANILLGNSIGFAFGSPVPPLPPAMPNTLGAVHFDNITNNSIGVGNILHGGGKTAIVLTGVGTTNNSISGVTISGALDGVLISNQASANTIGPDVALIGNARYGIEIDNSTDNWIYGTYISGNGLGGVLLSNGSTGNVVGGSTRNTISGNSGPGIEISSSGNTVAGNLIGLDTNQSVLPNTFGILIIDAGNNLLGGGPANTISGNSADGIRLQGSASVQNRILGNIIGLDDAGNAAPNGGDGIAILGGSGSNTIGGLNTNDRNVISGNSGSGISILGGSSNLIQANIVGLDVPGATARANGKDGLTITDSSANLIDRNYFSANLGNGIQIAGNAASLNTISGNTIGAGTLGAPAGNGGDGILISDSGNNSIGTGNLVTANDGNGVQITGSHAIANHIFASTITGNTLDGLLITGSASATTVNQLTLISGNKGYGVRVDGDSNTITGSSITGNDLAGVRFESGASDNRLDGNTVSDNSGYGVEVDASSLTLLVANTVGSNGGGVLITSNADANTIGSGNSIEKNGGPGIRVEAGATRTTIDGNTILSNAGDGVILDHSSSNTITANSIGSNGGDGVKVVDASGNEIGAGNTISGNTISGVEIAGAQSTGNSVGASTITLNKGAGVFINAGASGNSIGVGATISNNGGSGIQVAASGNVVDSVMISGNGADGILVTGGANTIRGTNSLNNTGNGIELSGLAASLNVIVSNSVGANGGDGILVDTANGNSIGLASTGNTISANGGSGVRILSGSGNVLLANDISRNALDGVVLKNASGNQVGLANRIVGHSAGAGIRILGDGAGNNQIIGSTIGAAGSANGVGILVIATNGESIVGTRIGGAGTGEGNIISSNDGDGIRLVGSGVGGTTIKGNTIGLTTSGATAGNGGDGIAINGAASNTVGGTLPGEANVVSANQGNGVALRSSARNAVVGNIIGATSDKSAPRGNALDGVLVMDSSFNSITANYIAASGRNGIEITGSSDQNIIRSNTIGARVSSGSTNFGNALDGILVTDATRTTIGGGSLDLGNTISANGGNGIRLFGSANRTVIGFNRIGVSGDAVSGVANGATGIAIDGTTGGVAASDVFSNTLGGNVRNGIDLYGAGAAGNTIRGNSIISSGQSGVVLRLGASSNSISGNSIDSVGVDAIELIANAGDATTVSNNQITLNLLTRSQQGVNLFGPKVVANTFASNSIGVGANGATAAANLQNGIVINQASGNSFNSNLVSANRQAGFLLLGGASGNSLTGNIVGLSGGGTDLNLGNSGWGVEVRDSGSNLLTANSIAANGQGAVAIGGNGSTRNLLRDNLLGLDVSGNGLAGGSPGIGVLIHSGASSNTVGAGNVISGFASTGLVITGSATAGNQVLGSYVGTAMDGMTSRANAAGIVIDGGATGNIIGSVAAQGMNVISGNAGDGVILLAAGNTVSGNRIGTDKDAVGALENRGNGIHVISGASVIGPGNTISGNTLDGIYLDGPGASGTTIRGNEIGLDANHEVAVFSKQSGEVPQYGIEIRDASNIVIGGPNASDRNTISGNGDGGIYVRGHSDSPASNIQIIRNYIGTRGDGAPSPAAKPLRDKYNPDYVTSGGENGDGIVLVDSGAASIVGNLISGNNRVGLYLVGSLTTGVTVTSNVIGLAADGFTPLPNTDGIEIRNAPGNVIGGPAASLGNTISGNISSGITIAAIGRDPRSQDQITNGYQSDPDDTLGTWNPGIPDGLGGYIQTPNSGANSNVVMNNFIGTDSTGQRPVSAEFPSAIGNAVGIFLNSVQFTNIRSNLVSGNRAVGIQLFNNATVYQPLNQPIPDSPYQRVHGTINTLNNTIAANLIGTNKDGTVAIPNGQGIYINDAWQNTIGGTTRADGNTISGNSGIGLQIMGDDIGKLSGGTKGKKPAKTQNPPNVVLNNWVGFGNRATPLPNDIGIFVNGARNPVDVNANLVASNKRGAFINRLPNYGPTVDIVTTPQTADSDPVKTVHVTFSQYVDPTKAANPANYVVYRLVQTAKGTFVTPQQQPKISIGVTFDVVNRTATLTLTYAPGSKPITFTDPFRLIVKAKITSRGTPAYALDGTFSSKPGYDFSTTMLRGAEVAPTNQLNKPAGKNGKSGSIASSALRVDLGGDNGGAPPISPTLAIIDTAIEQGGLTPTTKKKKS